MKRVLSIILVIGGIGLGIYGFNTLSNSGGGVEIGELEIEAQDTGQRNQGYILMGAGVVCLVLGVMLMRKS